MSAAGAVRTLLRLAALGLIVWAGVAALAWVQDAAAAMPGPQGRLVYLGVLAAALILYALILYALLLALPFVPGVEVGLLILAMQGPGAALPVYLATLAGLGLAYGAGRWLPPRWIAGTLADLGLGRAAALVDRAADLPPEARLALLRDRLPARLGVALAGWRYLLLAAALNVPGNWLLGGGGGLMLVAGLTGVFRPGATLLTVALAVAPVPLLIWAFEVRLI